MAGTDGLLSGKTGTLTLNKTTATRGSLLLLQYKLWLSGAQFHVSKLIRLLLLPSLSQSFLHQPPIMQSTDNIGLPLQLPPAHEAELPERPSRACLKSDYIELLPPASMQVQHGPINHQWCVQLALIPLS